MADHMLEVRWKDIAQGFTEHPPLRTLTAMELLSAEDDSDGDFCGQDAELLGALARPEVAVQFALDAWGIHVDADPPKRKQPSVRNTLVKPRGDIFGADQKFVCAMPVGLQDDDRFCLVKRLIGKGGCNMRAIADLHRAKVRLRGVDSGFLEGPAAVEANMPLQICVSCANYDDYVEAVGAVAKLLKDLHKHYRRYARMHGMVAPDLQVHVEEQRRDDLNINLLKPKGKGPHSAESWKQVHAVKSREGANVRWVARRHGGAAAAAEASAAARAAENERRAQSRRPRIRPAGVDPALPFPWQPDDEESCSSSEMAVGMDGVIQLSDRMPIQSPEQRMTEDV
eukprot:TRINITY_DN53705_c0_g1_i1.p1 TRINITY_DN53705_c0_g1~~TRINITY_DN53705_c0_g1_i1.p1  ORF type:complete len:340 (-),score=61.15 TRINITY_DN53705_c0_g1_i1:67-1086(-)